MLSCVFTSRASLKEPGAEQRRVDVGVDSLDVPSARVIGVFPGAVAEVQAEGHRCTMLRSVPATKQNDPIRYSQLLMLPLDVWRAPGQGLGQRSGLNLKVVRHMAS